MEFSASIRQVMEILVRAGFADLAEELQRLLEAGPGDPRRELPRRVELGDRDEFYLDDLDDERGGEASYSRRYSPEEEADLVVRLLTTEFVEPAKRVDEAERAAGFVSGRDRVPIVLLDHAFGDTRRTPALLAIGGKGADLLRALLPALHEALLSDPPTALV